MIAPVSGDTAPSASDASARVQGRVASDDRKVVLLTGASGRIGTAFCRRFASTYHIVAVRGTEPLKVASQLKSYVDPFSTADQAASDRAGEVFEVPADLREPAEVARVVEVALLRFGRIDALVNAVGAFDRRAMLLGAGLERVIDLFDINAVVPTSVAVQVAIEFWRHHDRENAVRNRVVINLSSLAALDTGASRGHTFGPTKAALAMLSLHLAEELRPFHVRVVTLAPAAVPGVVSMERVTSALQSMIEGSDTERMLVLRADDDELV
jgi:NAD(P)-dependent dehydrogenase (short-subunit alcohol dehydrogenase family)